MAFLFDIISIALFALLARAAHRSPDMPFTFVGVLDTMWPFLLGVAAGWLVLRGRKLAGNAVLPDGLIVWVTTVVVGLVIWGIRNAKVPHWSFVIVASVMSALLLLGWRGVAALRSRR